MELQSVGAPWVQDGGGAGSAESNANSDALAGVLSLTVRRRSHFVLFLLFFPIAYGYCGLWSGRVGRMDECCCLLLQLFSCHFCGYLILWLRGISHASLVVSIGLIRKISYT